ncbi:DUF1615 family protein [Aestuariivirga sp.]|uniref:DUF1615 family protein n=1 Tax=Aestuariivirga sp. TaxID=2650926 RepID=UPI0035942BB8
MPRIRLLSRIGLIASWLAGAMPVHAHDSAGSLMTAKDTVLLARHIVPRRKDPDGWGKAVWDALDKNGISPKRTNICAVMAVIEQESTFTPNPEVKGLGRMAEKEITGKLGSVPLLPGPAAQGAKWFLENRPSPQKSYLKRIRAARTERDLDLVFRNLTFYLFREYATTGLLNSSTVARRVDAANPVSTIGSMQVSVAFAIAEVEKAKGRKLQMNAIWKLRDELYTRAGGVDYGTRMLLKYHAGYESRLYVFADFNAGRYASRNAAFQHMVATLSGEKLALDGDLLIYSGAKPAARTSGTETAVRKILPELSSAEIRADLLRGKEYGFRDTAAFLQVSELYRAKTGKPAPAAMVPQIRLESPKLSKSMTTERFARAVTARYERCLKFE